jgi:hypothetical protein
MRKLVWFGAAGMVACAVAVYLAADYAAQHPQSYLGRCAAAAVYLGARSNPITVAAEMAHGNGACAAGQVGAAAVCGILGAHDGAGDRPEVAVKPAPGADADDQDDLGEPAEAAEPVEPIKPEVLTPDPAVPAPEGDENPDGQMVPFALPVVPMQTEEPLPGEETHQDALDVDQIEMLLPEKPVAHDMYDSSEDAQAAPLDIFDVTSPEAIPAPACDEDVPGGCASANHAAEEACEERPCGHRGGCCYWFKALMKLAGLGCDMAVAEAAEERREMLPAPAECADDEAQDEGTEGQPMEEVPSCPTPSSENNHYPHGGCPYMGGSCPYDRGTPVVTPIEAPKKVRIKKKPKQVPKKDMSSEKLLKKLFGMGGDEREKQMWIDTLDFRPSDDPRDPPGHSPF